MAACAAADTPATPSNGPEAGSPDRKELIVADYANGDSDPTFERVGESWGLSRERIRQIVAEWEARTGESIPRAPARRRAAREAEARRLAADARQRREEEARKLPPPPSIAQRMLAHVHVDGTTGCWEWTGPVTTIGGRPFPRFKALDEQFAHRVSYRLWCGPVPEKHYVLRVCDHQLCINPFHLFAASRAEALRLWKPQNALPPATHCKRGHELTADNTVWNTTTVTRDGVRRPIRTRLCRICALERHRRNYKKPPRRPPLPNDEHERQVELIIRRLEYARLADRRELLRGELHRKETDAIEIPALESETWEQYRTRTGCGSRSGRYADWLASRVMQNPRVAKALKGGRRQSRLPHPEE